MKELQDQEILQVEKVDTLLNVAVIHVDDLLTRGSVQATEEFYKALRERFKIKDPKYLTVDECIEFYGVRISMEHKDGQKWYKMDQEEEMEKLLDDEEFSGLAVVGAPMPNKHLLTVESERLNFSKETQEVQVYLGKLAVLCNTDKIRHSTSTSEAGAVL